MVCQHATSSMIQCCLLLLFLKCSCMSLPVYIRSTLHKYNSTYISPKISQFPSVDPGLCQWIAKVQKFGKPCGERPVVFNCFSFIFPLSLSTYTLPLSAGLAVIFSLFFSSAAILHPVISSSSARLSLPLSLFSFFVGLFSLLPFSFLAPPFAFSLILILISFALNKASHSFTSCLLSAFFFSLRLFLPFLPDALIRRPIELILAQFNSPNPNRNQKEEYEHCLIDYPLISSFYTLRAAQPSPTG